MLTLTGLIWIPLCVLAFARGLRGQVAVLGAGAVLSSAAVVNLGSFGVQPGSFVCLLVLGNAAARALLRGSYALDRNVITRLIPLAVFTVLVLHTLWWANAAFWDHVWVVSGRQMFDLETAQRYTFRAENFNQLVYLLINGATALVLADRLVRLGPQALEQAVHGAVRAAFVTATVFVVWDWAGHHLGFYFPDELVHSNAFYADAHTQAFGAIARISGSFAEPSALAYAYGGFLGYATARYLGTRSASALAWVLMCVVALMISTSTTAYALLALWAACLAPGALASALHHRRPARSHGSRLAVGGLMALAVGGAALFVHTQGDAIEYVWHAAVAGKTETGSYASRTGADAIGLAHVGETFGLGVGLGSHRPNSLAVMLLSNAGLGGTAAFALFVLACLRTGRAAPPWPARGRWPVRLFALGLLAGNTVSNPDLNGLLLWLALILNLAVSAQRPAPAAAMPAPGPAAQAQPTPRAPSPPGGMQPVPRA